MSDRHVHILAALARRSQRQLDAHNAGGASGGSTPDDGRELRRRAARTRSGLRAARARRSQGRAGSSSSGSASAGIT